MVPEILENRQGSARRLTLNRPGALNALTRDMVGQLARYLAEYEADPLTSLIVLDSAGEKAFCAGGDVARLYAEGIAGNTNYCVCFWSELYALVAQIAALQTPFVVLMDGIVMGGGAGLGVHGKNRVVTERTKLAMPECAIGLIPDVGVSHLLANAPDGTGHYAALTGARLNAAAAIDMGLADWFVPSVSLADLVEALMQEESTAPLDRFVTSAPDAHAALPPEAVAAFADNLSGLEERLASRDAPWAGRALKALICASPLSLELTKELLTAAKAEPGLTAALERELCAARLCLTDGDFLEGVRAAIIDKDGAPAWKPLPEALPPLSRLPFGRPTAATPHS